MSDPGPTEPNPFDGLPMFKDLAGMFTSRGPLNWDIARQVSLWVAGGGTTPPNVEPLVRMRFEELARIAEMHVAEITGLTVPGGGAQIVRVVNRTEWAASTLEAYRPLLERLAGAVAAPVDPDAEPDAAAGFLGGLTQMMSPVLVGMQAGVMTGQLAQRTFGQYDLPIPRSEDEGLRIVAANLDAFAAEWDLPIDDVRMWVLLAELTHHAVLTRPAVRDRIDALLAEYVGGFANDATAIGDKIADLDPTDPDSFEKVLGDPEAMLGAVQTDAQRATLAQLTAVVAAVEGFVDYVLDTAAPRLTGQPAVLAEAVRRRRNARGADQRFIERMLGLELTTLTFEHGSDFVNGVIARANPDALGKLWTSPTGLPTPAELTAPGLWLARLEFD